VQILYLPEVWHCDSDGSGAAITDFDGARINDELALQKRRIHIACGLLLSSSIEFIQLISHRGLFEFDDIIHNTLGTIIGIGMFLFISRAGKRLIGKI